MGSRSQVGPRFLRVAAVNSCAALVTGALLAIAACCTPSALAVAPADAFLHSSEPNVWACQSFTRTRLDYAQALLDSSFANNRFARYQGLSIAEIEYIRLDVFDVEDPAENNRFFRFFNALNMRTRASTIGDNLLFQKGDLLDPATLAETERNLRRLSYLSDAFVMPVAECEGRVHLAVVVKDAWTTQPVVSASREGGDDESKLGLIEGNFLGTGAQVSVVFTQDEQRSTTSYGFSKQYLFGQPLGASFGYGDSSDGYARYFNFGKPYYTEKTQTAFQASLAQSQQRQTIDQNDKLLASYDVTRDQQSAYVSWLQATYSTALMRVYAGVTRHEEAYGEYVGAPDLQPVQAGELLYPWLGLAWQSTAYQLMSNIDYIDTVEDINTGTQVRLDVGYSPASDGEAGAWVLEGNARHRFQSGYGLFTVGTQYDGAVYEGGQGNHYALSAVAEYLMLVDSRQRVMTRIYGQQSRPLGLHQAVTLGGAAGVRGYPSNYVLGDRAAGGTLEYRYHSPIHLFNVLRLGFAAYWDAAVLWDEHFGLQNNGYQNELLSSIGVGLRVLSSKTQVSNVVHIDIAIPTGYDVDAGDYQILLRAEKRF